MSNIGFNSNDLFIGRYELQQFQNFLQDEGYQKFIKENAIQFGLLNNSTGGNFTNANITEGVADNTIKHAAILGLDTDGKFFSKEASGDIVVGSSGADTAWYWVKLVRSESNLESGTISVSADGTLAGTGTDFETSLRGVTTDFPTRIKFPNASLNTSEYDVLDVTNNTTAALNVPSMSAEADLEWQIIPTATPNAVLTTDEKKLFNYDSCTISLVAESALTLVNGLPTAVSGEYWLARVRNSGTDVEIQDKRSNYIFKTVDGYFTSNLDKSANPLIGIEAIKFAALTDPRDKNIVELAFGMRSSNWTSDSNLNRVTLIAGEGGKFKDTSDFTSGDFDGWRLYYESGKYAIVKQSTLSATQINLTLDSLDVAELANTSQQLLVVPDCSEVEIYFTPSATTPLSVLKRTFPVNTDLCRIEVPVTSTTSDYVVTYRNKHIKDYGAILTIPDDGSVGYYTEASFNDDGSLKAAPDRVQDTYSSGTITLTRATNAYFNRISLIETRGVAEEATITSTVTIPNAQLSGKDDANDVDLIEITVSDNAANFITIPSGTGGFDTAIARINHPDPYPGRVITIQTSDVDTAIAFNGSGATSSAAVASFGTINIIGGQNSSGEANLLGDTYYLNTSTSGKYVLEGDFNSTFVGSVFLTFQYLSDKWLLIKTQAEYIPIL